MRSRRVATLKMLFIMLNGSIVDDPDSTKLRGGDTLVLSGAMPGLVGAMFRSDSPFKSMRNTITAADGDSERIIATDTLVRLKLLNTVLTKYKNNIIKHGFFVMDDEG